MRETLTTVSTFATLFEAELAKGFLESHGITVFLFNLHMSTIANDLLPITGGIVLQVVSDDYEQARQLLLQTSHSVIPRE